MSFCADVSLGAHAELSWFVPPGGGPPAGHADPAAYRRTAGERALFWAVLERRARSVTRARRVTHHVKHGHEVGHSPHAVRAGGGGAGGGAGGAGGGEAALDFAEFLQALVLACWRRTVAPPDDPNDVELRPSRGHLAGDEKSGLLRACRSLLVFCVLPHAHKLDVFGFRRLLSTSAAVHAALHALSPPLLLVFHTCLDGKRQREEQLEGLGIDGRVPHPPSSLTLPEFARMMADAGLLRSDGLRGDGLAADDVGGAFAASLPSHSAGELVYEGWLEALLRLAATSAPPSGGVCSPGAEAASLSDETGAIATLPALLAALLLSSLDALPRVEAERVLEQTIREATAMAAAGESVATASLTRARLAA